MKSWGHLCRVLHCNYISTLLFRDCAVLSYRVHSSVIYLWSISGILLFRGPLLATLFYYLSWSKSQVYKDKIQCLRWDSNPNTKWTAFPVSCEAGFPGTYGLPYTIVLLWLSSSFWNVHVPICNFFYGSFLVSRSGESVTILSKKLLYELYVIKISLRFNYRFRQDTCIDVIPEPCTMFLQHAHTSHRKVRKYLLEILGRLRIQCLIGLS